MTDEIGFIDKAEVPDMDLEGINREEIDILSRAIKDLIGDSACNYLLVIQGEQDTLCLTDGKIGSTRGMTVMQVLAAGVFSDMIGQEERHVLASVADVIETRFTGTKEDGPKIILN